MKTFEVKVRNKIEVDVIDTLIIEAEDIISAEDKAAGMILEGMAEPVNTEIDWSSNEVLKIKTVTATIVTANNNR